ncbi:MAG: SOS response-associated peptidase [Devosia sp.]
MCGRYAYILPPDAMLALFKIFNELLYPPRYNIVPTQPIVAIWEQQGKRTGQLVRWGFVPGWVKDPRDFPLLVNARAESMAEKPAFRTALKHRRCVIPASGYYEWMKGPDGSKQPCYITQVDDRPMAFAGLYSTWVGPEGEEVDTAAIVTVEPNLEISSVYDRMPAILRGEDAVDRWLDTRKVGTSEARLLAVPPPPGTMKYHPVGKAIGSSTAEGPELIRPLTPEEAAVAKAEAKPARRKKAASAGGGQLDLF